MGAPNLLADNMEYGLSYSVVSYLKKLSQQVEVTFYTHVRYPEIVQLLISDADINR